MPTETPAKATLQQRATHEIKELLILTVYLYITLGAVIAVKTAVLQTEGIEFAPWGVAIVKALVLAKFILIGDAMKIGEGHTGPLIWPTLQHTSGYRGGTNSALLEVRHGRRASTPSPAPRPG